VASGERAKHRIAADLLVGADGLRSRVARLVGARALRTTPHATASIYGYLPDLGVPGFEWYFAERAAVGAIPTNAGLTCVFASLEPDRLMSERRQGLETLFKTTLRAVSPELAARVEAIASTPRLRAFTGAPGVLRDAVGPGWALVGDAGYFKDPLTAHGITDALLGAELLARAVALDSREALAEYQSVRDRLARGMMDVTDRIASLAWTLEEVERFHLELSREMNAEVEVVRAWDGQPVPA
jgi:2-polyprenyl-6-methoxyphenol hydroxylase-like FAD-dependent oxidoreductase